MTDDDLIALSAAYFAALDARDATALERTLTDDCTLSVETHGQRYHGRAAIVELFATRWQGPVHARHHDFIHTPSATAGRIASQFTVTYTGDGAPEPKSNANVFTMRDGRIALIQVYMAGANSIRN
jgi:ketosteroid isomerase-like protein